MRTTWLFVIVGAACQLVCSSMPQLKEEACVSGACAHPGSEDSEINDGSLSMLQLSSASNVYSSKLRAAAKLRNVSDVAWKVISSTHSCEKNDQGINALSADGDFTLEKCKSKCLQAVNCGAIDYYEVSKWCLTYDTPCSNPTTVKDGSSSYRLQVGHSFGEALVQTATAKQVHNWAVNNETATCEGNEDGIPAMFHRPGFTLETCKAKCVDTDKCRAIDFYAGSTWCILYDEPCKNPKTVKDGSTSHKLLLNEIRMSTPLLQVGGEIGLPTETSSVSDVEKYMKSIGQPTAAAQMKEDIVDGEAFLMLKQDDLKDYGLKKGPVLKLSKHIKEARDGETSEAAEAETNALHEVVGADGVLMISLDSRPERFEYAADQLGKVGIAPTRFRATDASKEPKERLELACPHQDTEGVIEYCWSHAKTGHGCGTTSQQAIAMSHYEALKAARARDWEWTAIFEDDAVATPVENWNTAFRQAWEQIPPHVKLVRLGWCHMGLKDYPAPVKQRYYFNASEAFLAQDTGFTNGDGADKAPHYHYEPGGCTTAYLVHQDIISEMLGLFPCCGPVDSCYKWDFLKAMDPATGIEKGLTKMMDIDVYREPITDGNIEHHGLIQQDRDRLPSSQD